MGGRGQYWLLVNPAAGAGKARREAAALRARLHGLDVFTPEPGPRVRELAAEARRAGALGVVALGGDGTLFDVLNGFADVAPLDVSAPAVPRLALLPMGSGNSFLRDFEIFKPRQAIEALEAERFIPADCAKLTHADGTLIYGNILSTGFGAEVAALTNARLKPLGAAGYALGVALEARAFEAKAEPLTVDGRPLDAASEPLLMLVVSNSRCTGGAMAIAPSANPCDGRLDVITIADLPRLRLLTAFPKIYRGTHAALPYVTEAQGRDIVLGAARPQHVMVDGEVLTLTPQRIEVLPACVQVLTCRRAG